MDRIDVAKESIDPDTENILTGLGPISFKEATDSETR
jgi:hypothetical protein